MDAELDGEARRRDEVDDRDGVDVDAVGPRAVRVGAGSGRGVAGRCGGNVQAPLSLAALTSWGSSSNKAEDAPPPTAPRPTHILGFVIQMKPRMSTVMQSTVSDVTSATDGRVTASAATYTHATASSTFSSAMPRMKLYCSGEGGRRGRGESGLP